MTMKTNIGGTEEVNGTITATQLLILSGRINSARYFKEAQNLYHSNAHPNLISVRCWT